MAWNLAKIHQIVMARQDSADSEHMKQYIMQLEQIIENQYSEIQQPNRDRKPNSYYGIPELKRIIKDQRDWIDRHIIEFTVLLLVQQSPQITYLGYNSSRFI